MVEILPYVSPSGYRRGSPLTSWILDFDCPPKQLSPLQEEFSFSSRWITYRGKKILEMSALKSSFTSSILPCRFQQEYL